MARIRPRQDPQRLRDLKAGLDRGGDPRSWEDVAKIQGISAPYARRVAIGRMAAKPPQVWIDPREIVPQFAGILTDEDVLLWNDNPRCLCGCGQEAFQEVGNKGKVPYGAYRLFRGAHEKRMPWVVIRLSDFKGDRERRRRIGLARRAKNVQTAVIADLLNEWKIVNGRRGFTELARTAYLSPNHVRDIAIGRHERIHPRTAGKLLAALGEPMRPEIYAEYRNWARANGVDYQHVDVMR